MKKNCCSFIISFSFLFLCSCQKEASTEGLSSHVDVYVAGFEGDWGEPTTLAKYWKNGLPVNLSNGTKFTWANGIVVSGNDVFISGTEYTDTSSVAIFWKNGTATRLPGATNFTEAFALAISGQDIYVAGIEMTKGGERMPTYWKNGTIIRLPGRNITPTSVAVSGNNLYLTGVADTTLGDIFTSYHVYTAKYWQNGTLKNLSTNNPTYLSGSWATSIAVSGNDIYIAGNEAFAGINYYTVMKYWHNGASSNPMGVSGRSWAKSIAISNHNVYIAGWDYQDYQGSPYTFASYWKNDSLINIGTRQSFANSIAVYNNDVYIAGEEFNGTDYMATYWKNGSPVHLTDGSKHGEAMSISLAIK
jgi:hypothetical protein